MFERFTERARRVVVVAQEQARAAGNAEIGEAHILAALIVEEEGLAARVLEDLNVSIDAVRLTFPEQTTDTMPAAVVGQIPVAPAAKKVLDLALREALSLGHNYVGTEHILLGLARNGFFENREGFPDAEAVRTVVLRMLMGGKRPPDPENPTATEMLVEDRRELDEKLGRLSLLQMELATRGFFSSVTTFRVNSHDYDRRVAPEGARSLHSLSGWNARCNVVYDRFDRPAMDVLTGLAADHGCFIEWSMKHGVTFYPRVLEETQAAAFRVVS